MKREENIRKRTWAPRSGVVYLLFTGLIGLLFLEGRSAMTAVEHKIALLGIVLLFYAVMWVWLKVEGGR